MACSRARRAIPGGSSRIRRVAESPNGTGASGDSTARRKSASETRLRKRLQSLGIQRTAQGQHERHPVPINGIKPCV